MYLAEALHAREGKRLVFTNGVFDLFHAGHVKCLTEARKLGDLLIVGLNTEESARRLGKGPGRPVNTFEDRMAVLEALRAVDGVLAFADDTPLGLISALRPEVYVKGGDYEEGDLPEAALVRSLGGRTVIIPRLEGRSSSAILEAAICH